MRMSKDVPVGVPHDQPREANFLQVVVLEKKPGQKAQICVRPIVLCSIHLNEQLIRANVAGGLERNEREEEAVAGEVSAGCNPRVCQIEKKLVQAMHFHARQLLLQLLARQT